MNNIPEVKLGIIAVSRDCFPIALSTQRRKNIVAAYGEGSQGFPLSCSETAEIFSRPCKSGFTLERACAIMQRFKGK